MRAAVITASLLACLATPLTAQGGSSPETPAQGSPAQDGPAPDASPMDKRKTLAAKLAGLVGFANVACPDVQGDPALLKAAVERMGIDPADLDRGEIALLARSYLETYRKDVPENCRRAIETFGPSSPLVPNLIVKR